MRMIHEGSDHIYSNLKSLRCNYNENRNVEN
jgi:hypothetical protein